MRSGGEHAADGELYLDLRHPFRACDQLGTQLRPPEGEPLTSDYATPITPTNAAGAGAADGRGATIGAVTASRRGGIGRCSGGERTSKPVERTLLVPTASPACEVAD